ncbi:hypothetical protein ACHAXA_002408 [Cyclostephanos tholiformis]|jgi:hypothetical protein|uniref:Uncharacterized protein n=1 Tax=Cyclostephanos tholiformis TaxID=382380 RepID=A0ABD3RZU3_9STRA
MKAATVILSTTVGATMGFAPATTTRTSSPMRSTPTSSTSLAFFGTSAGKKKSSINKKSSPLAGEAVMIYTSKFSQTARGKFFWESWGMPESYQKPEDTSKSIFARKEADLVSAFDAIAYLYGDEEALKMVKIQPGVLAFNKDNFAPSLEAFGAKFGADEAREMVIRNPGLLSVKPKNAKAADDLTMQLSYVVDFTRPIGNFGPLFILGLVSVPAIESLTGVTRGELLSSLF